MVDIRNSVYHKVLRVGMLVTALVLVFQSGIISSSTRILSSNTTQYLANSVGAHVAVEPTELNTLTAEITAQKLALEQRESAIREREIEIGLEPGEAKMARETYILAALLSVLLALIILNYILDYLRTRESVKRQIFSTV
jgi:hypothetical protein